MSISALASDLIGGENKEHNGDWSRGVTGEGREGSGDSKGCVPERNESINVSCQLGAGHPQELGYCLGALGGMVFKQLLKPNGTE